MNTDPIDVKNSLPSDEGAERILLHAVMHSQKAAAIIGSKITRDSFYSHAHAVLWDIIQPILDLGDLPDIIQVTPLFCATGLPMDALLEIGSVDRVSQGEYESAMRRVLEKQALRAVYTAAYSAMRACIAPKARLSSVVGSLRSAIDTMESETKTTIGVPVQDLIRGTIERMSGEVPETEIIPTGLKAVDEMARGGVRRGQMILIGALRHLGKTALARQLGFNAGGNGYIVHNFFAESSNEEEGDAGAAVISGVPMQKLTRRNAPEKGDMSKLMGAVELWSKKNPEGEFNVKITYDNTPSLTLSKIESSCRLMKATTGLDIIFVDYLQMIQASGAENKDVKIREQIVSRDALRLKVLARQLGIVVYVLAQLNDEVKQTDEPQMTHIRESRGPANHSDVVLLLSAPPEGIGHDPNQSDKTITTRLLWNRKWRGVGTWTNPVELQFHGATQRFWT